MYQTSNERSDQPFENAASCAANHGRTRQDARIMNADNDAHDNADNNADNADNAPDVKVSRRGATSTLGAGLAVAAILISILILSYWAMVLPGMTEPHPSERTETPAPDVEP